MKKRKFCVGGKCAMLSKFEIKVLEACMEIPKGKTATYAQIAKAIGKPNSARAVGNALGKNPFAPPHSMPQGNQKRRQNRRLFCQGRHKTKAKDAASREGMARRHKAKAKDAKSGKGIMQKCSLRD